MNTHTKIGELWYKVVMFFAVKRWGAPYMILLKIGGKIIVRWPKLLLR